MSSYWPVSQTLSGIKLSTGSGKLNTKNPSLEYTRQKIIHNSKQHITKWKLPTSMFLSDLHGHCKDASGLLNRTCWAEKPSWSPPVHQACAFVGINIITYGQSNSGTLNTPPHPGFRWHLGPPPTGWLIPATRWSGHDSTPLLSCRKAPPCEWLSNWLSRQSEDPPV